MPLLIAALCLSLVGSAAGQGADRLEHIRLFQSFARDASIAPDHYAEGGLYFSTAAFVDAFSLGAQGGYALDGRTEINASGRWHRQSFAGGIPSRSGLGDLALSARRRLVRGGGRWVAGASLVLPTGSGEVGEGQFDFGGFAAVRQPLDRGLVASGSTGLDLVETAGGRDLSLWLAGGLVYPRSQRLHLIGELAIASQADYSLLSVGADWLLQGGDRVRGLLGLGLDDGAPDWLLGATYMRGF